MSENTATTTTGVSRLDEFEVCGAVVTLGKNKDMQAVRGGDDTDGYVMVVTDDIKAEHSKTAIRNGQPAQISAKTGNNPEKEGKEGKEGKDEKGAKQDKDDNTRGK